MSITKCRECEPDSMLADRWGWQWCNKHDCYWCDCPREETADE